MLTTNGETFSYESHFMELVNVKLQYFLSTKQFVWEFDNKPYKISCFFLMDKLKWIITVVHPLIF